MSRSDSELLQTLCSFSGISDDILMTGYRHDAVDLLQCMDVFVLCSFSEGTSMALLEAIASGIPAIVTNVGGNPEVIKNGYNGWVVPSDSTEDLRRAIIQAMESIDSRLKMAENAKKEFKQRFAMERMIAKYRGLYKELLGK